MLGYFEIVTTGFEKLGFSSEITIIIIMFMLMGSVINIPITRKKLFYTEERSFLSFFKTKRLRTSGVAVNVGGALIPVIVSLYLLFKVSWQPVLGAVFFTALAMKFLARIVPDKGIVIPALIPPFLSLGFSFIFAPGFSAACAFISGVLGTLIGADILNLRKAIRLNPGLISIGGAGVFDGIFLVGIVSALLT